MIREISQSQVVARFSTISQRKSFKNKGEVTNPAPEAPVVKYSLNNLKANYLTYKAASNISFSGYDDDYGDIGGYNFGGGASVSKNISNLPKNELMSGHYYDELANDVAITIGPGKNAILAQDEGVTTELLVHNFTRNMLDKKYTNEGLHPFNTDVIMFDSNEAIESGKRPLLLLKEIAQKDPSKKKVVFVEHFEQFLMGLSSSGASAEEVLKEGYLKNVQVVGLMSKEMYQAGMEGRLKIEPSIIKSVGKMDFDGLSAADTKDLLKKDARLTTNILKRYKDVDLKIGSNAIDAIVDSSAAAIDGSFPAKALKVLDLAAAAKAIELKSHKPGTIVPITSADVKKFFENHTGITSGLKPEQGQFVLAENIKTKMADVGGISTIKEQINDDIIDYLKNPKKFVASGREVPSGKLLYGPPGNGKTLLARAIAGETGVPFISASGSEFVEIYVGTGAKRMRELFQNARKAAAASEKHMAIVFIDEIDAFAKARGGQGGESESEKTLNQLLTEMDGFNKHSKNKILVLAATNKKDILDPALLRYGRLDGGIEVPNPKTHSDRLEILNIHAKDRPFANEAEKTKILNAAAEMTDGMSGADLAGVLKEATKSVSKRPDNKFITQDDIEKGCLQILSSLKPDQGQFTLAENVKTKLSDVGGISTIKEELEDDILGYLKDPKKFVESGREVPSGKLLYGPPGNGKTLLARAIAGETGIPFISASGSEFVEKYVGTGAQRMRELFDTARKVAASSEKHTAIVFIDEIDAFAKARGAGGNGGESESEKTLNQLLTEMDGFNKNSKNKVFVLAATNRKDILDPALLRFGRFDGGIEVPNPKTLEDRLEILSIHARNKPFVNEVEKAKILQGAAKITEGMSGADLAGLMAKAAKVVSKRPENQVITYNDMIEGFLQVHTGPMKKSDLSDADKKMVVRHEAGHAVVIDTLKQDKISFVTLDERGDFLGAVFRQPSDSMPNFKSVIYSGATSYAGGKAEPGFEKLGHGAGVSGDLENVTKLNERAITKWGLGVFTPQISISDDSPLSKIYEPENKKDFEILSSTEQKVATKIVDFHQDFLDEYMKKFEENTGKGGNNLSGEEFSKLREEWVVKNGKTEAEAVLKKGCDAFVAVAQNSKVWFEQIGKNINPIFEKGINTLIDTPQNKDWAKNADKPKALAKLLKGIDSIVEIAQNPSSLFKENEKTSGKNIEAELTKRIGDIVDIAKGEKINFLKKLFKAVR